MRKQIADSYTLTIEDPGVGFLTSNQRLHWSAERRATRAWRTAAGWVARAARIPQLSRVSVVAVVHERPLSRRRDVGNVYPTVKAILDGVVDAEVLPDDNDSHVIGPDLRRGDPVGKHEPRRIVLTITPLPQENP